GGYFSVGKKLCWGLAHGWPPECGDGQGPDRGQSWYIVDHPMPARRSRPVCTRDQFEGPSLLITSLCADSQSGSPCRSRARPFAVISTLLLRRQPSSPRATSPPVSSGRRFLVSVDRSIPTSLASAAIDIAPSSPRATRRANWVARSRAGLSASS